MNEEEEEEEKDFDENNDNNEKNSQNDNDDSNDNNNEKNDSDILAPNEKKMDVDDNEEKIDLDDEKSVDLDDAKNIEEKTTISDSEDDEAKDMEPQTNEKEKKKPEDKKEDQKQKELNYLASKHSLLEKVKSSFWNPASKASLVKMLQNTDISNQDLFKISDNPATPIELHAFNRLLNGDWNVEYLSIALFKIPTIENPNTCNFIHQKLSNNYWIISDGNHFGVVGFNEKQEGVFMDSIPGSNYLKKKKESFEKKFNTECKIYPNLPKQANSVDCGIFPLLFLYFIQNSAKFPSLFSTKQEKIEYFRQQ